MIELLPPERLEHAPIVLAIAQLRFPPLFDFESRPRFARFTEEITADYPVYAEEKSFNILISDKEVKETQGEPLRRYSSANGMWGVLLGPEQIALECRGSYSGIDDFIRRFVPLVQAIQQLGVRQQIRFGFRYVNELRSIADNTYAHWRAKLNNEYLGFNAAEKLGGEVMSTIAEVTVARPDGTFRLRRGFLPRGTTVSPIPSRPATNVSTNAPFYLIDLDYFDEQVRPLDGNFADSLRSHNTYMFNVFRELIGDGEFWRQLRGNGK